MEITSSQKMGKFSRGFFRRNSFTNDSKFQQTTATHKPKERVEYRQRSVAHECVVASQPHIARQEEWRTRAQTPSARSSDHESRNRANISCECRRGSHATGKDLIFRGKARRARRSKSLAAQNQMGLLTRSTSCGDMYYVSSHRGDQSRESSSGTDNEYSEVFVTDDCTSSSAVCVQCRSESSIKKTSNIGSLPNLNGINKENCTNGQLGLEVMLSLINGPFQSVIDSKDEKISNLERAVERLENENKQMKYEEKPADAAKILGLERNMENHLRQIEQLEEAKKTADETIRFLEDLRKNDQKYVEILKTQINDLETKLSESDDRVREAEKEWASQSERLKLQHEKHIEELTKTLSSKESKLRDYEKLKLRVMKQKQESEGKKNNENKLQGKMCQQILELKRELQLRQTKLNIVEKEKSMLSESLSQSENLQRQDQKSSYVLQMKIVELQEKLEASYRKNEEIQIKAEAKSKLQEENVHGKLARNTNENKPSVSEIGKNNNIKNRNVETKFQNTQRLGDDTLQKSSGKCPSVLEFHVNEVLRDKVAELQHTFYNKGEEQPSFNQHDDNLVLFSDDESGDETWNHTAQSQKTNKVRDDDMNGTASKKMDVIFPGDNSTERSSSEDSSSGSSSTSSSRRGSDESSRVERRQLKVLKVRKVSKENISHFQQNAAYITSLGRQHAVRKDSREVEHQRR